MNDTLRERTDFVVRETIATLLAPGKGILALDESPRTAGKRLASIGVESTEENRRRFRELYLGTVGMDRFLSGVILPDEGMWQSSSRGVPFPKLLESMGVVPGIKVDMGLVDMPGFPGETYATGLDGLAERLARYRDAGARFAKWRAAYTIDLSKGLPSDAIIETNAVAMAIYAAECHDKGIVPIVEPEVLLDGPHSIADAARVEEHVIRTTFAALERYKVDLSGVILKTSMAVPGSDSIEHAQWKMRVGEVATATVSTLKASVPSGVGGVVFLSGGQTPAEATAHLDAIAEHEPLPWPIAFSFARAIQQDALAAWGGDDGRVSIAREEFIRRLELCVRADRGEYEMSHEGSATR